MDTVAAGAGRQQAHELALGRLQRSVRHVVDEADGDNTIALAPPEELVVLAQVGRRQRRADDKSVFVEQKRHAGPVLFTPPLAAAGPRRSLASAPDRYPR